MVFYVKDFLDRCDWMFFMYFGVNVEGWSDGMFDIKMIILDDVFYLKRVFILFRV